MNIKYVLIGKRGFNALVLIFSLQDIEDKTILEDVVFSMMQSEFNNNFGLDNFDTSCLYYDDDKKNGINNNMLFYLEFEGNEAILEAHDANSLPLLRKRAEEDKYWL